MPLLLKFLIRASAAKINAVRQ